MITFFTNITAYKAAISGSPATDFTIPTADGTGSYSTAAGFTQSGVTVVGSTDIGYSLVADAVGYYGLDYPVESLQTPAPGSYVGNSTGSTTITVPAGTTAFGISTFDVEGSDFYGSVSEAITLAVTNVGGETATGTGTAVTGSTYTAGSGFLGVVSTTPITSMVLQGTTYNNFTDIAEVIYACFSTGTCIATDRGEQPVERLRVGQLVSTASGDLAPIIWIGHRHVDCTRHAKPRDVWPIRVGAGAFGDATPLRDLWLSPDHAVFIDGVLIPIRYLTNGASIVQESREQVTYWHVELERHDVLLADGLPCESYLDTGNRGAFENGGPVVQLHPAFALKLWDTKACAKLVLKGAKLKAARSWLLARAQSLGHRMTRDPDIRLRVDGHDLVPQIRDRWHVVELPPETDHVEIISRSGVPAATGDASTDHRRLGVAVSGVMLDGLSLPLHGNAFGRGWHACESRGRAEWRWTDGAAELTVPRGRFLAIEIAMTERYWLEEPSSAGQRRVV